MAAMRTTAQKNAEEGAIAGRLRALAHNDLVQAVVLGFVFLAASYVSVRIAQRTGGIGAIWLTNGLILTVLFNVPVRKWAGIALLALIADAFADLLTGFDVATAMTFSAFDLLEVFIIALPMRWLHLERDLRELRALLWFMALAFGPAIAVSSLLSAAYMSAAHGSSFWEMAGTWYMGDALGLIQVVPVSMLVRRADIAALLKREHFVPALGSIAVFLLVYWAILAWPELPLGFLLFPCILVLAFHQSYAGVALGLLLITAFAISNLYLDHGFLAVAPIALRGKIFFLQFFVIVLTATMLVVTSILHGKKKAEERLRHATQSAIEARNEALEARLEAVKANQTKSQFLANMSHELRTPLNAILGFSEIIRAGGLTPKGAAKVPEYAEHIHSAGSHLLDLVNDILDTSKIEAGKYELHLERLDLVAAVRDAVGLVEHRAAEKGVRVTLEAPAALPFTADYRALKQIALNLVSNAVKFTPDGGSVTVTVRSEEEGACLVVADTGIGIPASELPRLGRPFERVRTQAALTQPGTGLGLALVRSLAALHGASMTIESAETIGTTVSIRFPVDAKGLAAA